MTTQCKRSGFSLVELMAGMLAASIVALSVGSILYFSWVSWKRNNDSVNMQRDASLAMRVLAKEIRSSKMSDIETGSYLKCSNATFNRVGSDLTYKGMKLVAGWCNGFNTRQTPTNITVVLNLVAGGDSSTIEATFYTRN